jgi:phage recombination protein Bet
MTEVTEVAVQPEAPKAGGLMEQITKRGIEPGQWHTLCSSLFPGANPQSVLMVIDYCQARKLDPMKKPCHIVPMKVKDAKTGKQEWLDVVMPGIYEYRTTAQKTGEYLGQGKTEYGPQIDYKGVSTPEYCAVTVYRWNTKAKQRGEYTAEVYFSEAVSETYQQEPGKSGKSLQPNSRWKKAPRQMLTKCAEAAALRMAFPDELGGEMTVDEMEGKVVATDHGVRDVEQPPAIENQLEGSIDQAQSKTEALNAALEES